MKKRDIYIIANWKMNPVSSKKAEQLFLEVVNNLPKNKNLKLIFCPPFIWLPILISKSFKKIAFGAQNIFWKGLAGGGAFTGEISAAMVKNLGCKYVIIGHSERREYFNETDEIINNKIKLALNSKLKPILCIGEKEREHDEFGKPILPVQILQSQLKIALKDIPKKGVKSFIIAYEPRWAIGTGFADTPENTFETVLFIKRFLTQLYGKAIVQQIPILYGGSVSSVNASLFLTRGGVDGLLVGGASLNAKEFLKIIDSII